MFYTLIMQNRLMNIGWDKSKRIEDLTIEGSFHPKRDIDFENDNFGEIFKNSENILNMYFQLKTPQLLSDFSTNTN